MCEMCKTFIYDSLLAPLSINYHLQPYINMKSLKRCISEITKSFEKILKELPADSDIFEIDEEDHPHLILSREFESGAMLQYEISLVLWTILRIDFPKCESELSYLLDICLDENIARNTKQPEKIIKEYLMHQLHSLYFVISDIHNLHTKKTMPPPTASVGPVPAWKIIELRIKNGLPIDPKLNAENDSELIINIHRFDELYD